jgi:hydrogenase nickel insertion protein HypA
MSDMHEFGVTQAALEAALQRAEEASAAQITDVHLAIGKVSSIEPSSIRMYWAEISEDTIAERATLHFRRIPTECVCADCGNRLLVEDDIPPCPACEGAHIRAIDDEFLGLEAIDVEKLPKESARE